MNIGIISNTHDDIESTEKAIDIFNSVEAQYVFHAGDYIFPGIISLFKRLNNKTMFFGVRGNNDGEILGIVQQFNKLDNATYLNDFGKLTIESRDIGIYHGTNNALVKTLIESQLFDVLIFGHTHAIINEKTGKTLVLNPGSANKNLVSKYSNKGNKSFIIILQLENNDSQLIPI
ncbi:MAG: metallophosphoesterase [Thermoproteota archaeon]|nr:metallophosphoesterase [Thermoproteota archaeon]